MKPSFSKTQKTQIKAGPPEELYSISRIPNVSGDGAVLVSGSVDQDAWELAQVGKKQVLERRFGLVSMIGFSCSLMITWEGTIANFTFGLDNGGPAGLIWGFLVCWAGTASVFISMGELASMLPTAGGQYYWASILAPQKYRRFLGYVTGWITVLAWVAATTLTAFSTGLMLQYIIKINNPSFNSQPWQVVLFMYAALLMALIMNVWLGTILPAIEILILVLHIVGFFAFLVPMAVLGDVSDDNHVFTSFFNAGDWPTFALSFFIGLIGNASAFIGTDGAIHMAEEISRSSINTPRSMMLSIFINGVLGFVVLIFFLLVGGNLEAVLQSKSLFPYMQILQFALSNDAGVTVLVSVLITMNLFCIVALLSSASRMVWSFARELAMPGWSWLRLVDSRTSIPTNSTYAIVAVAALLGLINLGSTTTFNALLSLNLEGFCASYLVSISLLLYRRLRGDIKVRHSTDSSVGHGPQRIIHGVTRGELVWGPWRLKGALGMINNIFGIIYLIVVMFFGFWPSANHPTAANMNYSIVVMGGVAVLSMAYYFVARKQYTGPRIEVEITEI